MLHPGSGLKSKNCIRLPFPPNEKFCSTGGAPSAGRKPCTTASRPRSPSEAMRKLFNVKVSVLLSGTWIHGTEVSEGLAEAKRGSDDGMIELKPSLFENGLGTTMA